LFNNQFYLSENRVCVALSAGVRTGFRAGSCCKVVKFTARSGRGASLMPHRCHVATQRRKPRKNQRYFFSSHAILRYGLAGFRL
jgi:hypothetical protein